MLRPDDEILVSKIVRISPAYVIYTLDHEAAVATILEWLADQEIHSVGRFGEWAYFNMDDAIASGRDAVRSLQSGGEETIIDLVAAERGLPTGAVAHPQALRRRQGQAPRSPVTAPDAQNHAAVTSGRLELGGQLTGPPHACASTRPP